MKTRRFTLRAIFAAMLVVALVAAILPTSAIPSASVPPIIWGVAIAIGLVRSGGRGQACLISGAIAGMVGSAAAAAFIWFSPVMAFTSWVQPLCLVVIGGIAGCVVAILVRLVMEGLVIGDTTSPRDAAE